VRLAKRDNIHTV